MKYVRVTDKITILVPADIPDDEAREEYLLKLQAQERRYEHRDRYEQL